MNSETHALNTRGSVLSLQSENPLFVPAQRPLQNPLPTHLYPHRSLRDNYPPNDISYLISDDYKESSTQIFYDYWVYRIYPSGLTASLLPGHLYSQIFLHVWSS